MWKYFFLVLKAYYTIYNKINHEIMGKVLFSNSFNQTEYLRTLARCGQNTFALRVMNDSEICAYILEHGSSLPDGTPISNKEQNYIFYHLNGGDYADAKNLSNAINSYRDCVIGDITQALEDNLSNDFPSKKELIKKAYQTYERYKKDNQLYDKHDLMNYILSTDIKIDEECLYFEEYGITHLFLEVLNHVFNKVTVLHVSDVFPSHQKDIKFRKTYGKPCQIDYIFSEIQKYPIDECQIILTSNSDALDVINMAEMLHVPYTSHIGVPVISTRAGILLNYLFNLEKHSYGVDGYKALFNCDFFNTEPLKSLIPEDTKKPEKAFNEFIKYAGWLRLNFNSDVSNIHQDLYRQMHYEMLLKLQESLSHGRAEFIKEYIVNPTPLDEQVIEKIKKVEEDSKRFAFDINDVLFELLNSSINKKVSLSGHLFITDISSAISSLRKYNFIIGLTSDYPGGPKENYLIFDEEYHKTGSDLYLSTEVVIQKDKVLRALINASPELYLTYPYFELASLEDKNPSSVIFDLFPGEVEHIPSYEYKDMKLDVNKEVYSARLNNEISNLSSNSISLTYDKEKLLQKSYSPSMFYQFFIPEHYLAFLLSCILDINIDEEDDPYVVIPRNELGTLIHKVMERFNKNKISLDDFLFKAEKAFDDFLLMKPPLIPSSGIKAKNDYLRLVKNAYEMDPGNYYVFSERYFSGSINDIIFGGTADRLEKDKFGKYILVDYKTGANVTHKNEDPITCLQGLIYAYLIENYGDQFGFENIVVDHIEFRYPENKDTIRITYNKETKQALLDMMNEFKSLVESGKLFVHLEMEKQAYVDKYAHLFSLMKGVKAL